MRKIAEDRPNKPMCRVHLFEFRCLKCHKETVGDFQPYFCSWCGEKFEEGTSASTDAQAAVLDLANFVVEAQADLKTTLKANSRRWGGGWYEPNDEAFPFFSEAVLYPLIGKEDARTILALLRKVKQAVGMSSY